MAVAQKRSIPVWQNYLARRYGLFTIGLIIFSFIIGLLEYAGVLGTRSIGYLFLMLTIGMYALIGIMSRTKHLDEYYVAGRAVPAIANGMATGADWMSAASFISMAGTLWLLGYDGLAYIMGWTGGYVLLALLFAPYIRKFGQYTIPDFVGARYGGNRARVVSSIAAILISFTYVTAQVSGVGIIMSRLVGVDYKIGVVVGLLGVLVCSFLGGMKAVTWTQVAQYIILIIAYLVPVTMLSLALTGSPIPQLSYGRALQNIDRLERELGLQTQYTKPFTTGLSNQSAIDSAKQIGLTPPELKVVNDWKGTPWNFLALLACLMLGTAGLPHILIRFYTVPSVKESRKSVGYALFFIFLLYFTAPAYAAFSRWEILQNVVGQRIDQLPAWTENYARTGLLSINDDPAKGGNGDGILQFNELKIGGDLIVLATPEIAGLPYTVAALVAAGGLAAALSTADGLLVVIASAVAHDIFYKTLRPNASQRTRIAVGKAMILVGASAAALAAMPKLALIAQMVAWAFSLAAASFFPILLLGIFWKRANGAGAIAGMIGGLVVTISYMVGNYFDPAFNILGISHVGAGIFGMPVNFALTIIVSLLTQAPPLEIQRLVDSLRRPDNEPEGHDLRKDTGEAVPAH
ncbi:sodium:solute symporter family protein [Kallotenue papyrolyticum]|uniref:sodium:solute symporter family protein n=1 Tax=Kallotenue papyrolyticum TaxID=1325125 RepID=UPI00049244BB|nr:sodium:solute symporter family protein [Kallotenue papyrolyticum]